MAGRHAHQLPDYKEKHQEARDAREDERGWYICKIGRKKTFPIYKFFDNKSNYIFEVRYGDAKANALQRGMWTHTENAEPFFEELLAGGYKINEPLITLIAKILVSRKDTHEKILKHFFALTK